MALRQAAFGEHLTENVSFFWNQGVTLRQAAFGEDLTENCPCFLTRDWPLDIPAGALFSTNNISFA